MSSTTAEKNRNGRAEKNFRDAFERLKRNEPQVLARGAKVSQNNVAKEAGTVPSALRASRLPELVAEIRAWVEAHKGEAPLQSSRQKMAAQRNRNRELRERIKELEAQRDDALNKLVLAEARILELFVENERLQVTNPANVVPVRPPLTNAVACTELP